MGNKSNIFDRDSPSEKYQQLWRFGEAILEGFWTHKHFTYDRDVRDFKTELTEIEQGIIGRVMQAIAIVETRGPKPFWARIDQRMPHDVISDVGYTFSMNEVVHAKTYKALPELLGIDVSNEVISNIPCMEGRIKYLTKYLAGIRSRSDKEFTKSLILFTLMVENTSLFSQFLIINSFNKYKNVMSNFNAVSSVTAKEEKLHGQFGATLVNLIRGENPDWFDEEMENKIRRNVKKAFEAEIEVLDWILGGYELEFVPRKTIIEFIKHRFNDSLQQIGYAPEFEINQQDIEPAMFFERDLLSTAGVDFFNQKVTDYSVADKATEDDWDF